MAVTSEELGTQDIKKLLIKQAVPSSIGILFMSVNILIDTIFVGQWIGSLAIAALTVVLPITFLISSLGMAIGVGGGSVLSRALGSNDKEKAKHTFGNQIMLTFLLSMLFSILGLIFSEQMLLLFGAKGAIMEPAREFFIPIIISVPFLALCMMGNNIIRAEGKAKFAMVAMIIPAFVNIVLDIIFIKLMNLGVFGAAFATSISYFMCFAFVFWFFVSKSELQLKTKHLKFQIPILKEITKLSFVTFSRQGVVSILAIILNHTLYIYGGEHSITVYGIISRMLMFALFPILGITQGFLPIAGFNYGAKNTKRVHESVVISIKYAALLATIIFVMILFFAQSIVTVFTNDPKVIAETPNALRWVFAASPIIAIQLIGAAYFQAAGKAKKALFLTLTKQGFFLIPLVLILPHFLGIFGVWIAFPIADVLSTIITAYFLKKEMNINPITATDGLL
ncbi:putative MATE family efflux protein [Flavobacterium sp. 103]|uniref:MATE family efflux transporter n=1 Tax=unclassified Flavobacterium TaxID=196869 RepID=UPI000D5DE29B|nr:MULTISPECIES: MATE family efflux transporter [unclassified Flavobacterium]PVX45832.1 putative MATE family efflux protein [Flavobacterium sp. 103]QKJ62026.1 MATE family efflux transporter [Flavobacterium sp. M31R6]